MTTRSRREIREELHAELAKPAPDLERVAALTAELEAARRLWRRRRRDTAERARTAGPAADRAPAPPEREAEPSADPDAEALATWPPELRARRRVASLGRVIDGRVLDDPGGWGARNDVRNAR